MKSGIAWNADCYAPKRTYFQISSPNQYFNKMRAAGSKQKHDGAHAGSSLDGGGSKERAVHENPIRSTGKFEPSHMTPAPHASAADSSSMPAALPSPRKSSTAATGDARFQKEPVAKKLPSRKISKRGSNSFDLRPSVVDVSLTSAQSRSNREFKALCMGDLVGLKIGSGGGFSGYVQVSATQSCFVEKCEENDVVDLKFDTMVFRICPPKLPAPREPRIG